MFRYAYGRNIQRVDRLFDLRHRIEVDMTDYEAFKWILNDSENIPKNFSNPERCELLERLQRAFYETATIYYIINERGGLENVEYYKQT